jgi:hypothetical protein
LVLLQFAFVVAHLKLLVVVNLVVVQVVVVLV